MFEYSALILHNVVLIERYIGPVSGGEVKYVPTLRQISTKNVLLCDKLVLSAYRL